MPEFNALTAMTTSENLAHEKARVPALHPAWLRDTLGFAAGPHGNCGFDAVGVGMGSREFRPGAA
ncbi:MAG: hypothetical protein R3C71_14000 [Candidatus Krumholzibacteriia bacterium]|nr:hypothetical protein [bacterium]MCB9513961.1 hypothetical protein [Candidatus Latescibacterota bacterium]MCB9517038.1 hypothetical protein [Candidatus Latescibacterota bacterium]